MFIKINFHRILLNIFWTFNLSIATLLYAFLFYFTVSTFCFTWWLKLIICIFYFYVILYYCIITVLPCKKTEKAFRNLYGSSLHVDLLEKSQHFKSAASSSTSQSTVSSHKSSMLLGTLWHSCSLSETQVSLNKISFNTS